MTETHDSPDWRQCLARAEMLIERDRYADAAEWCKRGLQGHPDNDQLHALLAICWMNVEGRQDDAVQSARRSVGLAPDVAFNHAILSLAINHKAKEGQDGLLREALEEARKALELDSWSVMPHAAQTQVLIRLRRWREAEESARAALAIDPENPRIGAQLAIILHQLGKHDDHDHLAHSHLAQHPDSDSAHCNAGLSALRRGDHKTANAHFLEALRLDPTSELARVGLAESYRARSFFYRSLLRMDAGIKRLTGGREMAFWIGGYLAYRVLHGMLQSTAPFLAWLLMAAWLLLVFWTSLARGMSSFTMLFDKFARHCLRGRERWEGILVGSCVLLALGYLVLGIALAPVFAMGSLVLFLAATTVTATLTNDHHLGRWLYGGICAFCLSCALYFAVGVASLGRGVYLPRMESVGMWGIYTAVGFSFIRGFGVMYR